MPASPIAKMRARANQPIRRLSEMEKQQRRQEAEKRRSKVPRYAVLVFSFLLVGSIFVEIYFYVLSSPRIKN
ncbi:unnamed protein product [Phytomonas sp. EM1]|nr:unnamed protein product [Phytomonas sp. EM1]|eukprot:CCW63468.1 unnamed protein product [Phytomonas sp. isolate EM1]